jgi:hypothetical protein
MTQFMSEAKKKTNPLAPVAGLAGAAGGWALSHYCGPSIWIPGVIALLLLVVFHKTPLRPNRFAGAIATTGAHITWFIIGSAITGIWSATLLDIVLLSVAIVWLWLRPRLPAVLFLGALQVVSLALNAYSLSSAPFGSSPSRALSAHCVFRLIALACLVVGYLRLRREPAKVPPPVPDMAAQ